MKKDIISIANELVPVAKRIQIGVEFVIIDCAEKYKRNNYVDKEKYPTFESWSKVTGFEKSVQKVIENVTDSVIKEGDRKYQSKKAAYRCWIVDDIKYVDIDTNGPEYDKLKNYITKLANEKYDELVKKNSI